MSIEDKSQVLNGQEEEVEQYIWIKWEKKYELGIPLIDKQHRHLVELCNKLRRDLKDFSSQEGIDWHVSLANTLKELASYTQEHFSTEEKLMKACNYMDYDIHRSQHIKFVEQVTKQLMTFDLATLQEAYSLLDFLRDWILSHVACEDKLYVRPILEYFSKVRMQQQAAGK
ncbi:MAG: hemerythrin family protein [Spirochaetaceae bacterium]|nr:hemerythrin family protein [Spirochaetaceae bacterium]